MIEVSKLDGELNVQMVPLTIGTEVYSMNAPDRKLVVIEFDETTATCGLPKSKYGFVKVFSRETLKLFSDQKS